MADGYPKPRHQYVYIPRPGLGNRGVLQYQGQIPNGAPANVAAMGGYAYPAAYPVATYPVRQPVLTSQYSSNYPNYIYPSTYYSNYSYTPSCPYYYSGATTYPSSSYYGLYAYAYPLANFCHPYQRTYYSYPTSGYAYTPAYGYAAYPSSTTRTTTYTVTNGQPTNTNPVVSPPPPRPYSAPNYAPGPTRGDIQFENRRIATERGAYAPRSIRPADARHDDPFWCRERNGEWHLRTFYQIENECRPGRWLMDAELGYLVFHRE